MTLQTDHFDYDLDDELIAQQPLASRDQSRLMVLDRATGVVGHHRFSELPGLLRAGDLLVFNDTKVIPARFFCRRKSGGKIEGLFLRQPSPDMWEVLLKGADRCRVGEALSLERSELALELKERRGEGRWTLAPIPPGDAQEILATAGSVPLPPYIRRGAQAETPADRDRYQTVYARRSGAVAAPTAGLHFTPELLEELARRGIQRAAVTLHVGTGTFAPVKTQNVPDHAMHSEWYDLPETAAAAINRARREGRRVVAVGTTSLRVLEAVAAEQALEPDTGELCPQSGWTDIFIYPPYRFRCCRALITNFHLPRSTLLMLVAAFCSPGTTAGIETILAAYRQAMALRYRFYSYGDAMLIE